ncbi:MAG: S26 family signal peptidase [Nitrospiria bacterium]
MTRLYRSEREKVWFWILTCVAMFVLLWVAVSPHVALAVNFTKSLHYRLFVVVKHPPAAPKNGDFVYLKFPGHTFFSKEDLFMKVVRGVPGDELITKGRDIYLNGAIVARAKEKSRLGDPLLPLHYSGKIPEGKLFLLGEQIDSYDSRYDDIGLVDSSRILGIGYPIF